MEDKTVIQVIVVVLIGCIAGFQIYMGDTSYIPTILAFLMGFIAPAPELAKLICKK